MKRSLKELSGFTIVTKDGKSGKVSDFLFDEKQWICRYVEADFGTLFSSRKVLIPKVFLKPPLWEEKLFPTELGTDDIEKCPALEEHMPVSRKYEEALHKHFHINPYWTNAYLGAAVSYYPPRPVNVPQKAIDEGEMDTILRSFNEVKGYHVQALDGMSGHIDDLIIDDEDWQIVYAVVDTSNWLPWSKKVLIAIDWMKKISYPAREVMINLNMETIKNAPEYNPASWLDENFEKGMFDFYSRSLVN